MGDNVVEAQVRETAMGDNVVERQAREILAHFTGQFPQVLDTLLAEKERLQLQVQRLEAELEKERAARRTAEDEAEAYRHDYQKLYVKAYPPTDADIEFWREAKPSDFPYSWDDIQAMIGEVAKEHGIRE